MQANNNTVTIPDQGGFKTTVVSVSELSASPSFAGTMITTELASLAAGSTSSETSNTCDRRQPPVDTALTVSLQSFGKGVENVDHSEKVVGGERSSLSYYSCVTISNILLTSSHHHLLLHYPPLSPALRRPATHRTT